MKTSVTFLIAIAIMLNNSFVQGDSGKFYQTDKTVTYFINPSYMYTWYEAFLECNYRNMTLLSLEPDSKIDDILQIITKNKFSQKPPHLWIGGIGANRKFAWIDSGRPIVSLLWGPGNPDNSANIENCIQIFENTKLLNDIKCSEKMGFVCEMKKVQSEKATSTDCDNKKSEKYSGFVFNFNQGK
ncbi:salivary C-type lectin 2-like [Haematobia irritans]|uniref:salivary C-type lectin 2-like n=1 Tax=Haematobia irritans TaxID=7368 RepID=UPI003F4F8897